MPARAPFSAGPSVRVITALRGRSTSGAESSIRSPQAELPVARSVTGTATKAAPIRLA